MKTIYNGVGVKIEDNAEWVTRSQTININYPRGAQGDQKTKIYLCVFKHMYTGKQVRLKKESSFNILTDAVLGHCEVLWDPASCLQLWDVEDSCNDKDMIHRGLRARGDQKMKIDLRVFEHV